MQENFVRLILVLILSLSLDSEAAKPPSQETVDNNTWVAINLSEEQIRGNPKPKWVCQHAFVLEKQFTAVGETRDDAIQRAGLLCIKHQCQVVGKKIRAAFDEVLMKLNDEEFPRALKGFGYSDEEIARAVENRKNPNAAAHIEKTNCSNGSPTVRLFAVDACYAVPFECGRYKK